MTIPAWRQLHDAWWSEQRKPQLGDLEAAWSALWGVVPLRRLEHLEAGL